jgi:hypothetical protein
MTDGELADELGVGEKWLGKWKVKAQAPGGRAEEKAIARAIGEDGAKWLYDGVGSAPDPAAWAIWQAGTVATTIPSGAVLVPRADPAAPPATEAASRSRRGKASGDH